jgi:hypothetical protein
MAMLVDPRTVRAAVVLAGFSLIGVSGCGTSLSPICLQADLVLHQPSAPPGQRELKLSSQWAFHAGADDRQSYLLAFPLPGVKDGPRDFLLYLSAPAGEGRFLVAPESPDGVRGFMIQVVGELRGKATLASGQVRISRPWLQPNRIRLDLAVYCEDGTEITGQAPTQFASTELKTFERRYAADVALLTPASSQPSEAGDGTAVRSAPPP